MQRIVIVAAIAVSIAGSASAPPVARAAGEVKFCGEPRNGWQISAGNQDPRFPKTNCNFAKAAYDRANARPGALDRLPQRFNLRVRGSVLRCRAKSSRDYAEFRCSDRGHFVLAYKFKS